MFEGWIDMMRGMITAMVASTQMQHQQQREVLEADKLERERRWQLDTEHVVESRAREESEIARVSTEAAAQTAALNKIGTALERIASALEADKP